MRVESDAQTTSHQTHRNVLERKMEHWIGYYDDSYDHITVISLHLRISQYWTSSALYAQPLFPVIGLFITAHYICLTR